jgi:hypothetical protein
MIVPPFKIENNETIATEGERKSSALVKGPIARTSWPSVSKSAMQHRTRKCVFLRPFYSQEPWDWLWRNNTRKQNAFLFVMLHRGYRKGSEWNRLFNWKVRFPLSFCRAIFICSPCYPRWRPIRPWCLRSPWRGCRCRSRHGGRGWWRLGPVSTIRRRW